MKKQVGSAEAAQWRGEDSVASADARRGNRCSACSTDSSKSPQQGEEDSEMFPIKCTLSFLTKSGDFSQRCGCCLWFLVHE